MIRHLSTYLWCSIVCCCFMSPAKAQDISAKGNIAQLISAVDTLRNRFSPEKLYLHFDKPAYAVEDTIWFKAYLFEGTYLSGSEKSGLFYIELADEKNQVIKRMKFPLKFGLGWGNVALKEKEFPAGNYTLRAYTNWMRNLGEEAIFVRTIRVDAYSEQSWLVNTGARLNRTGNSDDVQVMLQFTGVDKKPVGSREVELRVMDGSKTLHRNKAQTGADGRTDLSFLISANTLVNNLYLVAEELKKDGGNRKVEIPLQVNRSTHTDVQFMPEGGNLVAGIPARVGFKAIGEDGKGVQITGKILNSKEQEVANFKAGYKGMGSFELTPQAGERYTAQVTLADGAVKNYALPDLQTSGTVLRVENPAEGDSLKVRLLTNAVLPGTCYLIGQARGVVCYARPINFSGQPVTSSISKSVFPSGIVRFSLLGPGQQPLNERIVFINHQDKLNISLSLQSDSYKKRDSIAVQLSVTDKDGQPVQGSFSMAVTDDNQVKAGSTATNIFSHLLLSSDLKGHLEAPCYYTSGTKEAHQALDNLLLTQGWTGYDWKHVFSPAKPEFAAEPEFVITGRATNLTGGIPHTQVALFSQKPVMFRDTLTDEKGRFIFRDLPVGDTTVYKIQAFNRKGNSKTTGLELDEWQPPVFTRMGEQQLPWYLNSDSTLLHQVKGTIARQKAEGFMPSDGITLGGVEVIAKRVVRNSSNLNGPGEADQVLDERDMQKAGKMSLLDLLHQQVTGFGLGKGKTLAGSSVPEMTFRLRNQRVKFIIDGIDVDRGYHYNDQLEGGAEGEGVTERYRFLVNVLNNFTAEDILGIEVMWRLQYNSKYNQNYLSLNEQLQVNPTRGIDYTYIEITTRSGRGPFINNTLGVQLFKPMPFSLPQKFYSPKYTPKNKDNPMPDLRATLHWEPNIVTDEAGKATVHFYSADKPATYTVVVEGSDMNSKMGSVTKEAMVKVGAGL